MHTLQEQANDVKGAETEPNPKQMHMEDKEQDQPKGFQKTEGAGVRVPGNEMMDRNAFSLVFLNKMVRRWFLRG